MPALVKAPAVIPAPTISSFADLVVAAPLLASGPAACRSCRHIQRTHRIQPAVFQYANIHGCSRLVEGHGHRIAARRNVFGVVNRLPQPGPARRADRQANVFPWLSVTAFTVEVVSFQPTTTMFKLPAVCAAR